MTNYIIKKFGELLRVAAPSTEYFVGTVKAYRVYFEKAGNTDGDYIVYILNELVEDDTLVNTQSQYDFQVDIFIKDATTRYNVVDSLREHGKLTSLGGSLIEEDEDVGTAFRIFLRYNQ